MLLDHGTYQHLPKDVMYNFAKIYYSVITGNQRGVEVGTEGFGIDKKYARFVGFLLTFSPPTKDPLATAEKFSHEDMEALASDIMNVENIHEAQAEIAEYAMVVEKSVLLSFFSFFSFFSC